MSEYEAEEILKNFEKWDNKRAKHEFIEKMERKMFRREKSPHFRTR